MLQRILQFVGYGVCHQLPERSFFAGDLQFPVCTRDTGTFLGFVVAFALLMWLGRKRRPVEFPSVGTMAVIALLLASWALDGATSYLGLRETTNLIRFATGLASGFALAAIITPVLNEILYPLPGYGVRVLGTAREVASFLGALALTFVAGWWLLPMMGAGYAVLSALSIVATFVVVNLGLVHLFKPFAQRIHGWRDLVVPTLIALVLTFVELALTSWLKSGVV